MGVASRTLFPHATSLSNRAFHRAEHPHPGNGPLRVLRSFLRMRQGTPSHESPSSHVQPNQDHRTIPAASGCFPSGQLGWQELT